MNAIAPAFTAPSVPSAVPSGQPVGAPGSPFAPSAAGAGRAPASAPSFRSLLLVASVPPEARPTAAVAEHAIASGHGLLAAPAPAPSPPGLRALAGARNATEPRSASDAPDEDDGAVGAPHRRSGHASATDAAPSVPAVAAAAPPFDGARAATAGEAVPVARAAATLEDLLPALVRRVAWSGDRRRGTVRLEIGAGELDGATLVVHAHDDEVRVELDVPPGVDVQRWRARLEARLTSRGVPAEALEVR